MTKNTPQLINFLEQLKLEIRQKFDTIKTREIVSQLKADKTEVTEFDLYISDLIKRKLPELSSSINFFSEEDQQKFEFPVCVLDPVDGTKEFIAGIPEFCTSFGIYYSEKLSDPRNVSWIYNPANECEMRSFEQVQGKASRKKSFLKGYVSRTEYAQGLYDNISDLSITPVGSIAYKLALLANGEIDFVVSRKPKNIWDILAGSHLCYQRGIILYQNMNPISKISSIRMEPEFIWCKPNILGEVVSKLK